MGEIFYKQKGALFARQCISACVRGGGDAGEEDSEQRGSCQGGRLLDGIKESGPGKSWQDMPQMKGLKELKLPVGNEMSLADMGKCTISAFYFFIGEKIMKSNIL